ncbi:hypothetical protein MNV49_007308 [Pseudohyphozyma bogoriensis]|nr:hypothetical protein MNV49_007308 [Pseudohyphozyma bogoriensis]
MVRTVLKTDTLDASTGLYHYPQTPSRVQLSIWAAGTDQEAQGTVDWAGGMIDWSDESYVNNGRFATYVQGVNVTCYNNPSLPFVSADSRLAGLSLNTTSTNTTSTTSGKWSASSSSTSTSTTVWWTAPTTSSTVAPGANATSVTSWKKRRALDFFKRQLAGQNITSYTYTGNSSIGQPGASGSNAQTVISSSSDTGLTAGNTADTSSTPSSTSTSSTNGGVIANPDGGSSGGFSSTDGSPTSDNGADGSPTSSTSSASPSATTVAEKWDQLSTAAHAGVYVGGVAGALVIVVGIGFLWNKASASRNSKNQQTGPPGMQGAYQPIDDGEMVATGSTFSGAGGGLAPGQQLYDQQPEQNVYTPPRFVPDGQYGAAAPYAVPFAGPAMSEVGSEASSSVTGAGTQYAGGYVPSAARMASMNLGKRGSQ